MKIYTTGYQNKSAGDFFEPLRAHGIECMIDIRIRPDEIQDGYARRADLGYLLEKILGCEYRYWIQLAPTPEMLDYYRAHPDWEGYVADYTKLLDERNIPAALDRSLFEQKKCCLMCYEETAEHCHRRLAAERLAAAWGGVEIVHL
jgi:uncharacterized protein (DUF488 family)